MQKPAAADAVSGSARARGAATALIVGALVMAIFMAMHPTVQAHDREGLVAEVVREARLNNIVHGVLMGTVVLLALGSFGFAEQLGLRQGVVRLGTVLYAAGALALLAAATINGVALPRLLASNGFEDAAAGQSLEVSLALLRSLNWSCDVVGFTGLSLALLAWSVVLLRSGGVRRTVGMTALLCGAAPILAMWSGHLQMTVHGVSAFVFVHGIWCCVAAMALLRGWLRHAPI